MSTFQFFQDISATTRAIPNILLNPYFALNYGTFLLFDRSFILYNFQNTPFQKI